MRGRLALRVSIVAALVVATVAPAVAAPKTLGAAKKEAGRRGVPVLADFYADW